MLTFENPVEACDGGSGSYKLTVYPNSHFLLSGSTWQARQPVLSRANSCCLSKVSREVWKWELWLSLEAVKSCLVELYSSSSMGGWRRSDEDLRAVLLESHKLCVFLYASRDVSALGPISQQGKSRSTLLSPATHSPAVAKTLEQPLRWHICLVLGCLCSAEHPYLSCCRESCTHAQVPLSTFQNALPVSSAWGGFPTKSSGFWACFQWWSACHFKRPRTDGVQLAWGLPGDPGEIISAKCAWFQVSWATFLQVCVIILPSTHAQKEDKFKGSHFSCLLAGVNTNISFRTLKRSLWFLFQGGWPETTLTTLLRSNIEVFLKSISDSY